MQALKILFLIVMLLTSISQCFYKSSEWGWGAVHMCFFAFLSGRDYHVYSQLRGGKDLEDAIENTEILNV